MPDMDVKNDILKTIDKFGQFADEANFEKLLGMLNSYYNNYNSIHKNLSSDDTFIDVQDKLTGMIKEGRIVKERCNKTIGHMEMIQGVEHTAWIAKCNRYLELTFGNIKEVEKFRQTACDTIPPEFFDKSLGILVAFLDNIDLYLPKKERQIRNMNRKEFDVFVSHATTDKETYVDSLVEELRKLDISIFYDKERIDGGDNLDAFVEEGLTRCEFGIVVISQDFVGRKWTEKELDFLLNRADKEGQKVIIPVLYNIKINVVEKIYPQITETRVLESDVYDTKDITIEVAKILIKRYKSYL